MSAHFDRLSVISEIGAKPSDLLQANGIIWVEGPSDCIYVNRWLEIYSGGKFQQGRDYLCAFYGGALLARTQFKASEKAESELVNLIHVNPNIVLICDGDRNNEADDLKKRVIRIGEEVKQVPNAYLWVTAAKEIENYIPGHVLGMALQIENVPDPGVNQAFFPRKGVSTKSFVESRLKRKSLDKVELASVCVPHMTLESMSNRFDWKFNMDQIVKRVEGWNK